LNWQPAMWVVKKMKKTGDGTRVAEVPTQSNGTEGEFKGSHFNYNVRLEGSFYVNSAVLCICELLYSPSCRRRVLTIFKGKLLGQNIQVCIGSKMQRPLLLSCDTSEICTSTHMQKIANRNCVNSFLKNIFVVPIQKLGNSYRQSNQ
jgi:hypothetical protein